MSTALFLPMHAEAEPVHPEAAGIREIDLSDCAAAPMKSRDNLGRVILEPIRASSAEELKTKLASFKDCLTTQLEEQVNFTKEDIIVFYWWGSGQDRITYRVDEKNKKAIFSYHKGMTEDLRRHQKFYIVDKTLSFSRS
jgi:hypothetical protein